MARPSAASPEVEITGYDIHHLEGRRYRQSPMVKLDEQVQKVREQQYLGLLHLC
jgi:hypothetical protein